jgi:predicted nucleic acid-binding protein
MPGSRVKGISCIVDTDIAIDFLRKHQYARQLLNRWADEGLLAVSALTHLEIYQGMKPGEEVNTDAFLDGLVSMAVDIPVARQAGAMLGVLRSKGITIGMADAIIAATALRLGVPLLTNNVDHYPFSGLKVIRGMEA